MTEATRDGDRFCPTCGAKTVEYRHRLNRGLVVGLWRLREAGGGPVHLKMLGLDYSQRCNFQKLRYWDVVRQSHHDDGSEWAGVWELTGLGRDWLADCAILAESVWTYRGERTRYEGLLVGVHDVVDTYELRAEWAAEAIAHQPGGQP